MSNEIFCDTDTLNWNKLMDSYEQYVDKYISFEKNAKDDMEALAEMLWSTLNEDNKVSLFVRYIDIATNTSESRIINKNK